MARPNPMPDPCDSRLVVFDDARPQLSREQTRRWLQTNVIRAEKCSLAQGDVARACRTDPALFSRYLSGERPIPPGACDKLQDGLRSLSIELTFKYIPLSEPGYRERTISAFLVTLNGEASHFGVPSSNRPFGVIHHYCLRYAYTHVKDWMKAKCGQLTGDTLHKLISATYAYARRESTAIRQVLEEFTRAESQNPVSPTPECLLTLLKYWSKPWQITYNCLGLEVIE